MEYQLKKPITLGSETVEVLKFPDKVLVKHLRAMDLAQGEVGKIAYLIASLAQVTPAYIDLMEAEDFTAISGLLSDFLPKPPPTSGT
jgi:hypothetical protein